ncbi:MAG: LamG-like jellyroll fold domain-containing protein, partial [Chitinophagaceae bacterium]
MKLKQLLLLFLLLILSLLMLFPVAAQTTAGLIAHFKLDGNTTNSGPANVTASAISTTYGTNNAGAATKALQFGGNLNSYIDFVDNGNLDFTGTNNFTVSFSFFFNGSSTSGLLDNCLNYGGWGVWLWSTVAGNWNLQFNYKNNSVGSAAATNFTIGTWHHVAAVRNNGTISLYIDGAFRLSATEGTTAPTYPINMIAGAMAWGGFSPPRYNPFGGKIDEL